MNDTTENRDDVAFDRTPAGPAGEIQRVSPLIRRLIAPNAGPFTFTGTCSYLVGSRRVAVIDPGPDDADHIDRLLQAVRGASIGWIVVTHTHRDHSPAARVLQARTGAAIIGCAPFEQSDKSADPPRSQDLAYRPDRILADGESLPGDGFTLVAVATPGHARNHLAFALPEEKALFSGDCVMAWSTTVVSPPDGNMADYMRSLDKLRRRDDAVYWPGHGGPVKDPQRFVRALANHRRHREILIVGRLRAGDRTINEIVDRLYIGLDPRLKGGAARSVLAHLEDLVARGVAESDGPLKLASEFRLTGDGPEPGFEQPKR